MNRFGVSLYKEFYRQFYQIVTPLVKIDALLLQGPAFIQKALVGNEIH